MAAERAATPMPVPRRLSIRAPAALAATALLLAAWASPAAAESPATTVNPTAESDNPFADQGSNYHYRSLITAVEPKVPGLSLQVLEFADRILLTNHTGRTVTVYGYEHEPYAQVLANGTVRFNTNSPAFYLNQNFYGNVSVPSYATPHAKAHWVTVDKTGELEWHDHRIHWMEPTVPPQVKNQAKRTKIFNWRVPITVGGQPAQIRGVLYWAPEQDSTAPIGAYIALAAIVLASIALVVYVRRRRRAGGGESEAW
ncbi:MAG TPA: hypothetical protein VMA83_02850 [Solirubrobacteraceae bacterium]|nr:hypothetical protein [Solirubrobacteraceae bacterium]